MPLVSGGRVQNAFPQAKRFRRSLNEFVGINVLDPALDIVARHALSVRGLDRASQPGIAARISAARLRGEADFLAQLAEILSRLASIAAAKDATQPKQSFPYTRLIFCHIPIVSGLVIGAVA